MSMEPITINVTFADGSALDAATVARIETNRALLADGLLALGKRIVDESNHKCEEK